MKIAAIYYKRATGVVSGYVFREFDGRLEVYERTTADLQRRATQDEAVVIVSEANFKNIPGMIASLGLLAQPIAPVVVPQPTPPDA